MILTFETLHEAGTSFSGYNYDQLRILGVQTPPKRHWLRNMIGREIPDDKWHLVMALKGVNKRRDRKRIIDNFGPVKNNSGELQLEIYATKNHNTSP